MLMQWAVTMMLGGTPGAVLELKPQELAPYVASHALVVVQLTSPDPGCGYCKGADHVFDMAASLPHQPELSYVRVQWSPWRQIPDFGKLMPVYGVPMQYVFGKGRLLGDISGRPSGATSFAAKVNEVIADPPVDRVAAAPEEAAPEAPPGAVPAQGAHHGRLRQDRRRPEGAAVSAYR